MNKAILEFLRELKNNNNREWFLFNRARYDQAKIELLKLSDSIINKINNFDNTLGFIDPKKTLFRINRDIRFSKNKDLYKTNLGLVFTSNGIKHSQLSCYYIHIEPDNNSFLSVGIYMPDSSTLKTLRTYIDDNWVEFENILNNIRFKSTFADLSRECKILKRVPHGFDTSSPAIEYLKFTSFYVDYKLTDDIVCSEKFHEAVLEIFEIASPLNKFINKCLLFNIV